VLERPWPVISAVLRLAAWPTFMLFGLMALVGPSIVPIVFGPAWEPATTPMALYAALSPAGALVGLIGVALVSAGNADAFQRLSIAIAFAQLAAIFAAAAWGLLAVVAAIGITQVLSVPFALVYLRRTEAITWGSLLGRIGPIVVAYVVCFVPCVLTMLWYPELEWYVGKAFVLAGGVLGFLLLRRDWTTVSAALAKTRSAAPPAA
jgi:O-antigen/teichoic acid export membrane protein